MRQMKRQCIRRRRPKLFSTGVEGWLKQRKVMEEITLFTHSVIIKSTFFLVSGINHCNIYVHIFTAKTLNIWPCTIRNANNIVLNIIALILLIYMYIYCADSLNCVITFVKYILFLILTNVLLIPGKDLFVVLKWKSIHICKYSTVIPRKLKCVVSGMIIIEVLDRMCYTLNDHICSF